MSLFEVGKKERKIFFFHITNRETFTVEREFGCFVSSENSHAIN